MNARIFEQLSDCWSAEQQPATYYRHEPEGSRQTRGLQRLPAFDNLAGVPQRLHDPPLYLRASLDSLQRCHFPLEEAHAGMSRTMWSASSLEGASMTNTNARSPDCFPPRSSRCSIPTTGREHPSSLGRLRSSNTISSLISKVPDAQSATIRRFRVVTV